MEDFENSSFTRPSGGVIEVKLALNSKNEKEVCGILLEFHSHRISSLINRIDQRVNEGANGQDASYGLGTKRWISEQLKERWMDRGAIEGTMDCASGG